MADLAKPALVTEILSGKDGLYDTGYPCWEPKLGRMMRHSGDTDEHRAWLGRMQDAQRKQPTRMPPW